MPELLTGASGHDALRRLQAGRLRSSLMPAKFGALYLLLAFACTSSPLFIFAFCLHPP
jgi:hypothetical protein